MLIPTPKQLGLPDRYQTWRPHQDRAILDGLECKKRFAVQVQRQGRGKTLTYMTQMLLSKGKRVVVLTSNKALQDQALEEWSAFGLVDIRGKSSYDCDGYPGYKCEHGSVAKCIYKGSAMCGHYSAVSAAQSTDRLITNYSCWIASHKYGKGFGTFDVMICDEAHSAAGEVAKAMQVQISEREVSDLMECSWPEKGLRDDLEAWKHWAKVHFTLAEQRLQRLKIEIEKQDKPRTSDIKDLQAYNSLTRKLADISTCKVKDWVVDEWMHGYQFDPIDPSPASDRLLFLGIPKVILTSGSIRPSTLTKNGIAKGDYEFFEYPSDSDPARSPVMHLHTGVKVNRNVQPFELKRLVRYIDRVIESRSDRKGIIHTASFKLRDFIWQHTAFQKQMHTNFRNGPPTSEVIAKFKADKNPGAILISPSITTGVDFPYDACRYQIVAKMPYQDMSSKVTRARMELNKDHLGEEMMQTFAQIIGRGDRADDDFQEVFVLDDCYEYAMWRYADYAPVWLPSMCREISEIPPAPELP